MQRAVSRYQVIQEQFGETMAQSALAGTVVSGANWVLSDLDEPTSPLILASERIIDRESTAAWETEAIMKSEGGELESLGVAVPVLPRKVLRFPDRPQPTYRFDVLQKWEGTVTSVSKGEFVAIIRDLTDRLSPDEEATFEVEEVAEADRPLMVPGAVFYWNVGYKRTLSGQLERVSALRFRRLPVWTRSEIEATHRKAKILRELFGIHEEPTELTGT